MVNGLHLYSAFIQSAVQFMLLIHLFTHTFTHQRRLAAMQGTNQLVTRNWGLGVLLRDTSTCPGWDRTGNPPTARQQLYLLSHIAPIFVYIYISHKAANTWTHTHVITVSMYSCREDVKEKINWLSVSTTGINMARCRPIVMMSACPVCCLEFQTSSNQWCSYASTHSSP